MTASIDAGSGATHADRRELEWQLATSDLGGVRHWVAQHPTIDGWTVEPRETIQLHDTYLDTRDWRIYRAGLALRVRNADGQPEATLKELRSARQGVADRRELTEPLTEPTLEALPGLSGPVGTRVQDMAGTQALRPLFTAHTSRERYLVRREGSHEDVGELALDETSIAAPDGTPCTTLQRVEVEAVGADGEALADFVNVLRRDCALELAAESKYQLGLEAMGLTPSSMHDIDASMRIDEVALAAVRRYLAAWRRQEPGARLGKDPEALHDLRVAGRRLETALKLFAHELPAALARMHPTFKKRLRALGPARDLDVALLELEKFVQELEPSERQELDAVRQHLLAERSRAQAKMARMLDAAPTRRCIERLDAATADRAAHPSSPRPAVVVIPGLLRARYKKLRKSISRLQPDSTAQERHAVRRKVKNFRYAVESVAALYDEPAAALLRTLRRMQEHLGEEHDSHMTRERLRELSRRSIRGVTPATMFLLGRMAERHASASDHARNARVEDRMNRQLRKRWKKLRRTLEQTAQARDSAGPL